MFREISLEEVTMVAGGGRYASSADNDYVPPSEYSEMYAGAHGGYAVPDQIDVQDRFYPTPGTSPSAHPTNGHGSYYLVQNTGSSYYPGHPYSGSVFVSWSDAYGSHYTTVSGLTEGQARYLEGQFAYQSSQGTIGN
jgi:hypothetical protein